MVKVNKNNKMDSDDEENFTSDDVNKKEKETFYNFYFREQEKYSKIYGSKTIVFIQNGKFYDSFCTHDRGYLKLAELEPLLNIKFIRRDIKKNKKTNQFRPNQFGIPCVSISKNLTTMIDNGYTIVIFDQTGRNGADIERECIGVFSPGTYISDRQLSDANYIMTVFIEEEKQLIGKKSLMAIGVTILDVTTGSNMVHEFYSDKNDERFGLDELVRIMQTFRPTESVVYYKTANLDQTVVDNIKSYLELKKYNNCHFYIYHNKKGDDQINLLSEETFKINYQNDYLAKVFDFNNQVNLNKKQSPLEILQLERHVYAIVSLLIMFRYITEHNTLLLKNLSWPTIYMYNEHLILGNNAIEQLNVIDSNSLELYNEKIKSLFDVINRTSTPMGKRYLKQNLLNPISQENKKAILTRYDRIDALLQGKLFLKVKNELKNIYDMERLQRRMGMGMIAPFEFYRLDLFYQATSRVITLLNNEPTLKNILTEETIKDFLSYQIKYNKEFDFDKLQNYSNFSDIDHSFFKKGIHASIDKIQEKIDYVWQLINATKQYLSGLIEKFCNKINGKDLLEVENNERDGYYFTIAKTREKFLKQELGKKTKIKIDLDVGKTFDLDAKDIVFKQLQKGRTKIFIAPLVEHTLNLTQQTTKLTRLIKNKFIESMIKHYSENKIMLHKICRYVSEIDFLVSGAIVANEYYYCRPQIPSQENIPSYFQAKGLRHAIIERLCNETEYIPNDVELGNVPDNNSHLVKNNIEDSQQKSQEKKFDKNGILLYGLNSSGKSSYMKAIGIALIMAQMGYYVPAEEFVYEPYMALYARITGNDNIFKGLSSFALEMTELDSILMRTEKMGPSTIVIGDEICRGTEDTSGISIVAAALITLSECGATFIFSSHLHELPNITEIKALNNLRFYHLRVEYDEENDCLLFDRKLTPGSGPKVYGLMVAKYLIKNPKFISRAETIKKRIMKEDKMDLPVKTSNYNRDLLVKSCAICHYYPEKDYYKELESHHIHFQKDCLADGRIRQKPHLSKNRLYNLVVLCRKCHTKVHRGEIVIKGYNDTSIGPMLEYHTDINKTLEHQLHQLDKFDKNIKNNKISASVN